MRPIWPLWGSSMLSVLISDNPVWSDLRQPIQAAWPQQRRAFPKPGGRKRIAQGESPGSAWQVGKPRNGAKEALVPTSSAPFRGSRVPHLSQCSRTGLLCDAPPGLGLRSNRCALRRIAGPRAGEPAMRIIEWAQSLRCSSKTSSSEISSHRRPDTR
jgi:hypothetical protein